MPPIGSPHGGSVNRIAQKLSLVVGNRALVAVQNPIRIDDFSEPQPDIALLRPREDSCAAQHPGPGDVPMHIEVAETPLR